MLTALSALIAIRAARSCSRARRPDSRTLAADQPRWSDHL